MRLPRPTLLPALAALAGAAWAFAEGRGLPAEVLVPALWLYAALGALAAALLELVLPPLRRRRRALPARWVLGALALLAGASYFATRPASRAVPPPEAPEIVLITCDTTRADRWAALTAHAAARGEEDAPMEAGATAFAAAYAPTALTAPSHASLLTGLHPHQHGVFNNGAVLPPWPRLPEELRAAGWTTLAAPSVIHLDPGFGFARGFDEFARVETGLSGFLRPLQSLRLVRLVHRVLGAGRAVRDGEDTLARAVDLWRAAAGARPRFLWAHIFEPHWPYEPLPESRAGARGAPAWPAAPTPGFGERRVEEWRALYDAEVLEARRILRAFVAALRADRADSLRPLWIVFTSDHGEAIGEHAAIDHGDLLYEEQLRVPFWVLVPGSAAGVQAPRVDTPISHVDLLPSLCELLGLDPPADLPGRSWAPALRGEPLTPAPIYGATRHPSFDNLMVLQDGRKLIRNYAATREKFGPRPDGRGSRNLPAAPPWTESWELYDLSADPLELRPIPRPLHAAGPELAELLRAMEAERGRERPAQNLSPDVIDSLRELGYF